MPSTELQNINAFLDYIRFQKRYSEHTIVSYRTDLRDFFLFLQKQYDTISPADVKPLMVRDWLASLKDAKISSRSVNRKISSLKSFFKYQQKIGAITASPMAAVTTLKTSRRLPVFMEEKDMEPVFEASEAELGKWQATLHPLIFTLLYQTGIRLSELIQLRDDDIDGSRSALKVLGKGKKERLIPLQNALLRNIELYTAEKRSVFGETGHNYLLVNAKGRPLYPKYVYRLVNSRLSELVTMQRKSPHVLRHTFATHLSNAGAEINAIKELLGHSSLAATQVYTHNSIGRLREIHKQAHPKS